MARAALFAATAGALAAPMLTQVRARLAGGWGAHAKERAAWGQAGQQAPRRALADAALNSDRAGGLTARGAWGHRVHVRPAWHMLVGGRGAVGCGGPN